VGGYERLGVEPVISAAEALTAQVRSAARE